MIKFLAFVVPVASIYLTADADPYRGYFSLLPNHVHCCGGTDCHPLADGDVTPVKGGYQVHSLGWFIPNDQAQPGPDQHYHMCETCDKSAPRCFLIPSPGV